MMRYGTRARRRSRSGHRHQPAPNEARRGIRPGLARRIRRAVRLDGGRARGAPGLLDQSVGLAKGMIPRPGTVLEQRAHCASPCRSDARP